MIGTLFGLAVKGVKAIATSTGVDESIVSKVIKGVENHMNKDERIQKFIAEQQERARQHDVKTFDPNATAMNSLRSSVRPVITYVAFGVYIGSKIFGYELSTEDHIIIGTILAFWFGARPFDKKNEK